MKNFNNRMCKNLSGGNVNVNPKSLKSIKQYFYDSTKKMLN